MLDTRPQICAATLSGSLQGNVDVSSGGGEVDLDATFGYCPFCYTDSWTLVKWGSLASTSYNLFNDTLSYQAVGLPGSLCPLATTVSIVSPTPGASLSSGVPTQLTGLAAPNDSSVPYTSTYQWSFTPGANASTVQVISGATSANPVVLFGSPKSGSTSNWTVNLTATTTVHSQGGAVITKTASATPVNITVTTLQPGDYITQISTSNNGVAQQDSNGVYQLGNIPQNITIDGAVAGAGKSNTTFVVAPCNDQTPQCTSPGTPVAMPTTGATTGSPVATWPGNFSGGYYRITMTTTVGSSTFATTSAIVFGYVLI